MAPIVAARARVIIDNDFSGDLDDLFQTAFGDLIERLQILASSAN